MASGGGVTPPQTHSIFKFLRTLCISTTIPWFYMHEYAMHCFYRYIHACSSMNNIEKVCHCNEGTYQVLPPTLRMQKLLTASEGCAWSCPVCPRALWLPRPRSRSARAHCQRPPDGVVPCHPLAMAALIRCHRIPWQKAKLLIFLGLFSY